MKQISGWMNAAAILLILGGGLYWMRTSVIPQKHISSESFVKSYLLQPNGFIRTNITDRKDEYLAESLGLWMLFLVNSGQKEQFEVEVTALRNEFLTADNLVTWQIIGRDKGASNALIDDIRIIQTLYTASDKWNESEYSLLADQMSDSIANYQTHKGILTDFVETASKEAGTELTLSYIIPQALDFMDARSSLPESVFEKTRMVLLDAPISAEGLFPKQFSTQTNSYMFDTDVNMIDQYYTGYHRAVWNADVSALVSFTKQAFNEGNRKLYGRYDSKTGRPSVSYESASVYALAIMMCLETDEQEFAEQLSKRMEQLAVQSEDSPYHGGYMNPETNETHSFDNLLPLLAKQLLESDGLAH